MRPGRTGLIVSILFASAAPLAAQTQGSTAFVDVNVIPMDRDDVLAGQTVVVRDGKIVALGSTARTAVPQGATRVDGRGKYLIPGLAEMHGHVPWNPHPQNPDYAKDVVFLYVAAGATTVRGMQGNPALFDVRRRVESGEWIGPRLYLSSPQMGGNVTDAATAERLVREHKAAGYDLLKVQEGITKVAYEALVRTAREVNIPFGGHVSVFVGIPGALAAKQSTIDHLDDYIDAAQRDDSPALTMSGGPRALALPLHIDESKIPALARATKDAGVAVVPTMALWEVIRGAQSVESMRDRPELRYMPPLIVQGWVTQVNNTRAQVPTDVASKEVAFRNKMLKALSDAGVTILMGTDAPQIFSVPGFSLHRELRVMAEAGMTPRQILLSGTVAVARHMGTEAETGTIAVGKRADLLLLDANPLTDITNVEKQAGVMVNGRWLPQAEIQRRLQEIAARYQPGDR